MIEPDAPLSRRKFLIGSAGAVAAAAVAGTVPEAAVAKLGDAATPDSVISPANKPLLTRTLGRTGLVVPIVSVGGGGHDPAVYQACYEAGLTLYDTDARYMNGHHEATLGEVFHRLGVRKEIIILTKMLPPEERRGLDYDETRQRLGSSLEGSLRRLRTDYIDIYMIHDVSDADTVRDRGLINGLQRAKIEGKTRHIGLATHTNMAETINAAVDAGVYDVILTAVNFTMADDVELLAAIDSAAAKGVGVVAMKTQAGGYDFPNPSTRRDYSESTVNSAALKWVCNNPSITTSIPGISNFDHLRMDLAIGRDPSYTDEEKRLLADNRIRLGLEFCRQCRKCLATCPRGVDIPILMRGHMYARQYADFEKSRRAINALPRGGGLDACGACEECTARCAWSVRIGRKIDELKLIYG